MDIYKEVTNRLLARMEKGEIPWQRPWSRMGVAHNRVSGKPYSLINQILLEEPGEYATFAQWNKLGGKIKPGAKGKAVVFWSMVVKEKELPDGTTKKDIFPILRYHTVFHISDVTGVEPKAKIYENKPIDEIEILMGEYSTRTGVKINETISDRAYYSPLMDSITLPERKQFADVERFYATAFHEMVHSTGHISRLNRLKSGSASSLFGGTDYSKEELVAEIGAATLTNMMGLETDKSFENSAAYLQSWIKALQNDKRLIVSAAANAEKAVNYILGKTESGEEVA